ncbi:MAG: hypothetical protein GY796_03425 [Chloroflexi bacterium]|nr:hypothetical protein [Chloroflexota bacterium]
MNINLKVAMLIGFILFGLLVLGITLYKNKTGKGKSNYRALFAMGAAWLPAGIVLENPGLWGIGAVFLLVGLANKDKWQEEKTWSDLSPAEKKLKLALVGGLSLLLITGVAVYFLTQSNLG